MFTLYKDKIRILNKPIRITYQFDCQNPNIIIDGEKLEKSISFLMDNAVNFTQTGDIFLSCILHEDREIKIFVKDTGFGISPKQQKAIFKSFNQVDNSYTRRQSGAGIGLILCSKYITLMKGSLNLESDLDYGSTFHLTVPAKYIPEDLKAIQYTLINQTENALVEVDHRTCCVNVYS